MRAKPLHEKVESLFGSGDLRMIYGMGTPVVGMTLLIIAALVIGETWLVAPLMALIAVSTAVVLMGINYMLDEDE